MSKKPGRRPLGVLPAPRVPRRPPALRGTAVVPKGDPMAHAPTPHVSQPPKSRGVGALPNPRKPRLVRHVDGGGLKDLFAFFPDLPRPRRPAPRLRGKRKASRK
jgi:hypothetical protein